MVQGKYCCFHSKKKCRAWDLRRLEATILDCCCHSTACLPIVEAICTVNLLYFISIFLTHSISINTYRFFSYIVQLASFFSSSSPPPQAQPLPHFRLAPFFYIVRSRSHPFTISSLYSNQYNHGSDTIFPVLLEAFQGSQKAASKSSPHPHPHFQSMRDPHSSHDTKKPFAQSNVFL